MRDVIVICAGLGGMSCAALMAKARLDVLVLEASEHVSGCCQTSGQDGILFKNGALWLSMDYLCDQVFAELGADFCEMIPTVRLNPSTRCLLPDGETFLFEPDKGAVANEIERLSPRDLPRFHAFLEDMECRAEFVSGDLYNNPMTFCTMLNKRFWKHAGFF
jgi:diapolycopene oxygenase